MSENLKVVVVFNLKKTKEMRTDDECIAQALLFFSATELHYRHRN